jgi:beta-glucosidase
MTLKKPILFSNDEKLLFTSNPIDFLGINYYSTTMLKQNPDNLAEFKHVSVGKKSGADWLWSYPEGILLILRWINERYIIATPAIRPDLKLMITENGCATNTTVEGWSETVELKDTTRVEYYKDHVEKLIEAKKEGIPLIAYFAWTITDNFEWGAGYTERFGLIYVDFEDVNRRRVKKDSFHWWREEIAKRRLA